MKKLGVDHFIATDEQGWEFGENASSLDLIVSTVSSDKLPLVGYSSLLAFRGTFVQVGAPEDPLLAFSAFPLIMKAVHITGSAIGWPKEIEEMLQLIVDKGIKPWTQEIPIKDANKAVIEFENGKPRYQFVLKNENYSG